MTIKLFNLLALTSLAIIGCSFGTTPVNAVAHSPSLAHRAHAGVVNEAKRKRGLGKRCAPRTPAPSNSGATSNAGGDPNGGSGNNNNGGSNNSGSGGSGSGGGDSGSGGGGSNSGSNNNGGGSNSGSNNSGSNNSGGSGGNSGSSGGSYTGPSSAGKKVCLAWGGSPDQIATFAKPTVGRIYNWSPSVPDEARQAGLEIVPMIWGERDIPNFQQTIVEGYASEVMAFNEPNQVGQANLDPGYAAQLWIEYIEPLKYKGYRLIGPATTSNPNGVDWYNSFLAACNGGCTIDVIPVHWYDVSADAFIAYVENWHNLFGKPIWVTEFACQNYNGGAQCTADYIPQFMAQVTQFMNNADYVETWCPFGFMESLPDNVNYDNILMDGNGQPTALGWQVLNGGS